MATIGPRTRLSCPTNFANRLAPGLVTGSGRDAISGGAESVISVPNLLQCGFGLEPRQAESDKQPNPRHRIVTDFIFILGRSAPRALIAVNEHAFFWRHGDPSTLRVSHQRPSVFSSASSSCARWDALRGSSDSALRIARGFHCTRSGRRLTRFVCFGEDPAEGVGVWVDCAP